MKKVSGSAPTSTIWAPGGALHQKDLRPSPTLYMAKILLPTRKVGSPQASFSVAAGNARQIARSRSRGVARTTRLYRPVLSAGTTGDKQQIARLMNDRPMPHALRHDHTGARPQRNRQLARPILQYQIDPAGQQADHFITGRMHFPSRPILRLVRDDDEPSGLKVLPTREVDQKSGPTSTAVTAAPSPRWR